MVEVFGEATEVREVVMLFQQVRDAGATHHLPGHHLAAVFAEVRRQAHFTAGNGQHAEAQFRAVAAFDVEQLEQRCSKGSTDQQAEATVAREVAANLSPPVVKRAMRGEVVVTRRGLLEEDAGIAAEAFAIGQDVAVAVPACGVGEAPLCADVAGLQVFGKAFLAALVGRHTAHITAHDAPAAAFADVFPR